MRKRRSFLAKRMLALALSAAVVFTMMPAIPGVGDRVHAATDSVDMSGGMIDLTVNSTAAATSVINYGGHPWYAVKNDSGKLTLLSKTHFGTSAYRKYYYAGNVPNGPTTIVYAGETYKKSPKGTALVGGTCYYVENPSGMAGWTDPNDYVGSTLWLKMKDILEGSSTTFNAGERTNAGSFGALEHSVAKTLNTELKWITSNNNNTDGWWTRTATDCPYRGAQIPHAAFVSAANEAGMATHPEIVFRLADGVAVAVAQHVYVRPSFELDIDKILFTSTAAGGKSNATVGAGFVDVHAVSGSPDARTPIKFTIKDSSQSLNIAESETRTGLLHYTDATYGAGQYISCIIKDKESGAVKSYAKLKAIDTQSKESGTVQLPDIGENYQCEVFMEQANGSYNSDICSEAKTVKVDRDAYFTGVEDVAVAKGTSFNPMEGVTATDANGDDLTKAILGPKAEAYNVNEVGTYELTYEVVGESGRKVTAIRTLTVKKRKGVSDIVANSTTGTTTVVKYGGYDWYVLRNNQNVNGGVKLLLKDNEFLKSPFRTRNTGTSANGFTPYNGVLYANNESGPAWAAPNEYAGSTLQNKMKEMLNGSGAPATTFLEKEQTHASGFGALDKKTAEHSNQDLLTFSDGWWWLKTAHEDEGDIAYTAEVDGSIGETHNVGENGIVRPVFDVYLGDMIMASTAGSAGKSSATLESGFIKVNNQASPIKFTLEDKDQTLTIKNAKQKVAHPKEKISFEYSDAKEADNRYISCLISDKNTGNPVYYAKLKKIDKSSTRSGSVTVTLPDDIAERAYTLELFSEEVNEDAFTDFASEPVSMGLIITEHATIEIPEDAANTIQRGAAFDPMEGVTARDVDGTPIDTNEIFFSSNVDTSKAGTYYVNYTVTGSDGVETSVDREIVVRADDAAINGVDDEKTVYAGTTFNAMSGVTATDGDGYYTDLTDRIVVGGSSVPDPAVAGKYQIIYKVTGANGKEIQKRMVLNVVKAPEYEDAVIYGVNDVTLTLGEAFDAMDGITAGDEGGSGDDLTSAISVTNTVPVDAGGLTTAAGEYEVTYKVTGKSGNEVSKKRTVTVLSSASAVIKGIDNKTVQLDENFDAMAGVSAEDGNGSNIPKERITVEGKVNTSRAGTYAIVYKVTGSNGREVAKTRVITVKAKNATIIAEDVSILKGTGFNYMAGVKAYDGDGRSTDITDEVTYRGDFNVNIADTYTIVYKVRGSNGEEVQKSRTLTVVATPPVTPKNAVIIGATDKVLQKGDAFNMRAGVVAYDNGGAGAILTSKIDISGDVDKFSGGTANETGTWHLTYSVTGENGKSVTVRRTIKVQDVVIVKSDAVIYGAENTSIARGAYFNARNGVTAYDDGGTGADLTDAIVIEGTVDTSVLGANTLVYKVTGTNGNEVRVVRTVNVTIQTSDAKISGPDRYTIDVGDSFDPADIRVTARDDAGNGASLTTAVESNNVNTSLPGEYEVVFSATGENGVKVTHEVSVVVRALADAVIYGMVEATITRGDIFDPLAGVSARDNGGEGAVITNIDISDNLDTTRAGKYEVTYSVTGKNNKKITAKRDVTVLSTNASLEGIDDVEIELGSNFNPRAGVRAVDGDGYETGIDFTVTGNVDTRYAKDYNLTYKAKGTNGVEVKKDRTVTVKADDPVFSGVEDKIITKGESFNVKKGVSAKDGDGYETDLTSKITLKAGEDTVDTDTPGVYKLTYIVSGKNGNAVQKSCTVTVSDKASATDIAEAKKTVDAAKKNANDINISTDGSDVWDNEKWVTAAEKREFDKAISDAEAVLNKNGVTNAEIDQAIADLNEAANAFRIAQKDGLKTGGNVNSRVDEISEAVDKLKTSEDGHDVSMSDKWVTQEEMENIRQAIHDALNIINDSSKSLAEKEKALEKLEQEYAKLISSQKSGDKEVYESFKEIEKLIEKYKTSENGHDVSTDDNWVPKEELDKILEEIKKAEAIIKDSSKSLEEKQKALEDLQKAFEELKKIEQPGDKEIYERYIEIQKLIEKYKDGLSEDELKALEAKLKALEDLLNNLGSSLEDKQNALKDLEDGAGSLIDAELATAKKAALAELDKIDVTQYAGASRQIAEAAIAEGKAAINAAKTVAEVEAAKNAALAKIAPLSSGFEVGTQHLAGQNMYQIIAVPTATGTGDVMLVQAKNARNVNIPKTVTLSNGKTYDVIRIAGEAFKAKKIRKVTLGANVDKIDKNAFRKSKATKLVLRTKALTKKSVKGSLKGSKIKTVQVKVGAKKVNQKFVKKYKKFFTTANVGRKVTVK
ncbi:MAG: DUF5011 domain-containing protein [Mogibacterium sp.]|nr:DUF5011 domain-containing protein [Mogibacterium sp.]